MKTILAVSVELTVVGVACIAAATHWAHLPMSELAPVGYLLTTGGLVLFVIWGAAMLHQDRGTAPDGPPEDPPDDRAA